MFHTFLFDGALPPPAKSAARARAYTIHPLFPCRSSSTRGSAFSSIRSLESGTSLAPSRTLGCEMVVRTDGPGDRRGEEKACDRRSPEEGRGWNFSTVDRLETVVKAVAKDLKARSRIAFLKITGTSKLTAGQLPGRKSLGSSFRRDRNLPP